MRGVLLHGCPGDLASWEPLTRVAPALEAVDLLDHGRRPPAPDATLEDLVADATAMVAARPGPLVLGGHSAGAWLAVHVAARLPDHVTRVVLLAGLVEISGELAQALEGFAAAFESGALAGESAVAVAAPRWLGPAPHDPDHVARIRALVGSDTPARFARQLRRIAAASMPVPVLRAQAVVVHAESDQAVPLPMGEALATRLGTRVVTVPGANHFVHWADPAGIARHFD